MLSGFNPKKTPHLRSSLWNIFINGLNSVWLLSTNQMFYSKGFVWWVSPDLGVIIDTLIHILHGIQNQNVFLWNSSFVALICSFHIACSLTDNAQEIVFFFYLLSRLGCRPRWWWTATTKRYCTSTNGLRDISLVSDNSRWSFMLANVFTRMLSWKIGTARPGYCFYTQAHVSSSGQSTSRRSCNYFRIMPETPNIRTYHYIEAAQPKLPLRR